MTNKRGRKPGSFVNVGECSDCGHPTNPISQTKQDKENNVIRYSKHCPSCIFYLKYGSKMHLQKWIKKTCEQCGFIAKYHCQLDIDHIDGNHYNDDEDNLMCLCANCHRAKTFENKEHRGRYTQ